MLMQLICFCKVIGNLLIELMMAVITWKHVLANEKKKSYFIDLQTKITRMRQSGTVIYPPQSEVFNAFKLTPFEEIKVVIIGQDPYHGAKQAHGLCFSVNHQIPAPPSLKNIFKAIFQDLGIAPPAHGCLEAWARQGVLLLNTVLTVEHSKAHSHAGFGWEQFTDQVIRVINEHVDRPVVYLLWGGHALKKAALIDHSKHLILRAPHPSPLSAHRGFFTCQHFSRANEWLKRHGAEPINWQLN